MAFTQVAASAVDLNDGRQEVRSSAEAEVRYQSTTDRAMCGRAADYGKEFRYFRPLRRVCRMYRRRRRIAIKGTSFERREKLFNCRFWRKKSRANRADQLDPTVSSALVARRKRWLFAFGGGEATVCGRLRERPDARA